MMVVKRKDLAKNFDSFSRYILWKEDFPLTQEYKREFPEVRLEPWSNSEKLKSKKPPLGGVFFLPSL